MAASSSSIDKYQEAIASADALIAQGGSALGLDDLIDLVVSGDTASIANAGSHAAAAQRLDTARNLLDIHTVNQIDQFAGPEFAPDEYANRPDQFTVLEVTNLRNEFAKKFYVHAIMAHMGTLAEQAALPAEQKQIVRDFLRSVWAYDPAKHLRSAYKVIQEGDERERVAAEHVFAQELAGVTPPALEQLQSLDRFISQHYEDLCLLVSMFYGEVPDFEDSVIVYDTFPTKDAASSFVNRYSKHFLRTPVTVQTRRHTVLAPTRANRERVQVISDNERVASVFQEQQEAKILARDLLQNRVERARKSDLSAANSAEFQADAKRYAELRKMIKNFSGDDLFDEEASRHMREFKELREKLEVHLTPDGAVAVPCTVIGEDGKASRKIFYTKTEKPAETEDRLKKTFKGAPDPVSPSEDRDLVQSLLAD